MREANLIDLKITFLTKKEISFSQFRAPPSGAAYAPRHTTTPLRDPAAHNVQRKTSFQFVFTSVFNTRSVPTYVLP
jgi:hypothetical protein